MLRRTNWVLPYSAPGSCQLGGVDAMLLPSTLSRLWRVIVIGLEAEALRVRLVTSICSSLKFDLAPERKLSIAAQGWAGSCA